MKKMDKCKKERREIIKNNPLVDEKLLVRSQKELKELQKMGLIQDRFNLVLPYSRSVTSAVDT